MSLKQSSEFQALALVRVITGNSYFCYNLIKKRWSIYLCLPLITLIEYGVLAIIIVLLLSSHSNAVEYYISSSMGNDNNSGLSINRPWKSLSKLHQVSLSPGDKVLLKAGDIWWESLKIRSSGTFEKPILFTSYGVGKKPRIFAGKKILNPLKWVRDNTTISGKNFYKCQVNPVRTIYGLWKYRNGAIIEDYFFRGNEAENCINNGDFVYRKGWIWLLSDTQPDVSVFNCVVYGDYYNAILVENQSYVNVQNIDALCSTWGGKNYHGGIGVYGLRGNYAKGVKIIGCNASHNSFVGIGAEFVDGLQIESCIASNNGRAGGIYISSGSKNIQIVKCESYYNGKYPNIRGADRGGISVGGSPDWHENVLIDQCVSHHNGLWDGGYVDGGIHLFKNRHSKIINSISHHNGGAGIMINGEGEYSEGEENEISDCLVYRNGMMGDSMYTGGIVCFRPSYLKRNIVANNNLKTMTSLSYSFSGIFLSMGSGDYPCIIENNIIYCNAVDENSYELYIGTSFKMDKVKNNCLFNSAKEKIVYIGKKLSWNEYSRMSGGSFFRDPLFVNPEADNYLLLPNSPCRSMLRIGSLSVPKNLKLSE